jgi:hypothetical protein
MIPDSVDLLFHHSGACRNPGLFYLERKANLDALPTFAGMPNFTGVSKGKAERALGSLKILKNV